MEFIKFLTDTLVEESVLMLPVISIIIDIYTLSQGTTIGGANASRWIRIPFVGSRFPDIYVGWINFDDLCCKIFG